MASRQRSRWRRRILWSLLAVLTAGAGLYALLRRRSPYPLSGRAAMPESLPSWWESPPPLTEREVAFQRWLAAVTSGLPRERWSDHWNVGGGQYGVFSIRYQAAFAGYAAAALGMRTPAYPAAARRILESSVDHLVDRSAWRYIASYWGSTPWFPDPCAHENVMYTGHLLQLMALHEALSGDRRYRDAGVELVWDETHRYRYTTLSLAEVTVAQMRANPSGGVPCEPGLIFFPCNNHPHVALRLLEGMGLGDWSAERRKWEQWALSSYYANLGGGAFKLLYHQDSKLFVPRGHPGLDGWSLLWYAPWAEDPAVPRAIWQIARRHIPAELVGTGGVAMAAEEADSKGSSCCNPAQIPPSAVASFLAPAARACGDAATATALEQWLDARFLKQSDGCAWLDTHPEWRIGVTANRILAEALANGSDLRGLVQRPLPRDWFRGPLLAAVEPPGTAVFEAWRDQGDLVIGLDGHGQPVALELQNVPGIARLEGCPEGTWSFADSRLRLPACGRLRLRIVAGRTADTRG